MAIPLGGTTSSAEPFSTAAPTGYTPAQVRHAYGFDNILFANGTIPGDGAGTTIAIVDAYDNPNIASDLHQFSLAFGLPEANFTKVNQTGGTTYPPPNSIWATEIALDVQWAHAIAPKANILLVEANSNSYSDLLTAVSYAASVPGVSAVSMSWGSGEFAFETFYSGYFTTPTGHGGVTFVASSGDTGSPVSFPSVSPNVLSVGGTTLNLDAQGNWINESGWGGSGGGISAFESKPAYQNGVVTQTLTKRANPDVSYNSSPSTGYPVYDSYNNGTTNPWGQWGGTSAAAPQWGALVAIANQGRALAGKGSLDGPTETLPLIYSMSSGNFHDITTGGSTGSPNYAAGPGYDLVTGRGSPYANLIVNDLVAAGGSTSGLTVTSVAAVSPNPRNTAVSTLDFTFSSVINASTLGIADLTLTRSGGANLLTASQTISLVSGTTYRINNIAGLTGVSGTYVLTVNAAGVLDAIGVAGIGTASTSWTADMIGPTVGVSVVSPNPRNTAVNTIDFTFSETINVSTLGVADLTLTRNGGANLLTAAQTITLVSGATYRINNLAGLTGVSGAYVLSVNATGVQDAVGNAGTGTASTSWTADTVGPTVGVAAVVPNPRNTAIDTLDFTFSEAIAASMLGVADLTLTLNGGANLLTAAQTITWVSGTTYRINNLAGLTGVSGAFVLSVNATGVQDAVGNAGTGTASTSWTADTVGPAVGVAAVSPNPRNTAVSTLDFTFSEAIDESTLGVADLTLTLNGGANLLTAAQTITFVSGTTYRVNNLAGLTGVDGTYALTAGASGVNDLLGNAGSGSGTAIWAKDTFGPAVSSIVPISPNPRNSPVGSIDVILSEAIDPATFDWHDVFLTHNGSANLITAAQSVTWISGTTWRIGGLAPLSAIDGSYILSVNATGIRDLAGNAGKKSKSMSWNVDTLVPISQMVSLPAQASGLSFVIAATGSDPALVGGGAPSGVSKYDIYVSTNGSSFVLWKTLKSNSPSATFTGQSNTDYAFLSIAYDRAGNVETKPATVAEAWIHVPDLSPPTSKVTSVTSTSPVFNVNMQGNEVGGGALVSFDLYVLVDGEAAQQIAHIVAGPPNAAGLVTATAQYDALAGTHAYRFFTIATDSAGNVEAAPANGDMLMTYTSDGSGAGSQAVSFGMSKSASHAALDAYFSRSPELAGFLAGVGS